jgi:hypothetical protein
VYPQPPYGQPYPQQQMQPQRGGGSFWGDVGGYVARRIMYRLIVLGVAVVIALLFFAFRFLFMH